MSRCMRYHDCREVASHGINHDGFNVLDQPTMYNGERVYQGAAACSPEYRLGTEFWLEGKHLICTDRGRLVRTELWPLPPLDVWESDCGKCKRWGRQTRRVTVWQKLPVRQ